MLLPAHACASAAQIVDHVLGGLLEYDSLRRGLLLT